MLFRTAFRYISYRKLHDMKLPTVLARFANQDPKSSPSKTDNCSKTKLETTESITIHHAEKMTECCREGNVLTSRCDHCPYDRYD